MGRRGSNFININAALKMGVVIRTGRKSLPGTFDHSSAPPSFLLDQKRANLSTISGNVLESVCEQSTLTVHSSDAHDIRTTPSLPTIPCPNLRILLVEVSHCTIIISLMPFWLVRVEDSLYKVSPFPFTPNL
jgi:hypothetical protein